MPYTGPIVQPRSGEIMLGAATAVSDNIRKSIERYRKEKEQSAFNDTMVSGQMARYIPKEQLERYFKSKNVDEQNGIVLGGMKNMAVAQSIQDQARQQQVASDQMFALRARILADAARDEEEGRSAPIMDASGQPVPDKVYVKGARQIVSTAPKEEDPDTLKKLDSEVHLVSGHGLDEWLNATKKGITKDPNTGQTYFTAEPPPSATVPTEIPKGVSPEVAAIMAQRNQKATEPMRMLKSHYDEFVDRYNMITNPPKRSTPVNPPAAAPAARGAPRAPAANSRELALEWLQKNPDDERAPAVRKKLGM